MNLLENTPVSDFLLQFWIASGIANTFVFHTIMTGVVNYVELHG